MDALSGEILAGSPNNILIDGVEMGHAGPTERRRAGCGFLPEERNGHGAVGAMSLSDNAYLSAHKRVALDRLGLISGRRTDDSPPASSAASTCARPGRMRKRARFLR